MVIGLFILNLHGLYEEMLEIIICKFIRGECVLRVNEFQLMPAILQDRAAAALLNVGAPPLIAA